MLEARPVRGPAAVVVALAAITSAISLAAPRVVAEEAAIDPVVPLAAGDLVEPVADGEGRVLVAVEGEPGTVAIHRFTPDGAVDGSFGVGGVVALPSTDPGSVRLHPIDGGGLIVTEPVGGDRAFRRLDDAGSPDDTYGTGGTLSAPADQTYGVAGDGSAYALDVASGDHLELHRFTADGSPDPSFGTSGTTTVACCGAGGVVDYRSLLVEPGGSVVISGRDGAPGHGEIHRIDLTGSVVASGQPGLSYEIAVRFPDGSFLMSQPGIGTVTHLTPDLRVDAGWDGGGASTSAAGPDADPIRWTGSGDRAYGLRDRQSEDERTAYAHVCAADASGVLGAFGTLGCVSSEFDAGPGAEVASAASSLVPDGHGGVLLSHTVRFDGVADPVLAVQGRLVHLDQDGREVRRWAYPVVGPGALLVGGGRAAVVVGAPEPAGWPGIDGLAFVDVPDPDLAPFASAAALAEQLAQDVEGRSATPEEIAAAEAAIAGGGSADDLVLAAVGGERWTSRIEPVVRLYVAYFGRLPDPSGLRYWMGRRDAGLTVARISAVFADSSEFRSTYGSLTNRQFVELVYRNVLDREGDAGGIAFWTGRLDRRVTSRGHLMASFSESSEYQRATGPLVGVVSLFQAMLGRPPVPAEVDAWRPRDPVELAAWLLASDEYAARVNAG